MGDGGEGGDEYRINSAGAGDALRSSCSDGDDIWEQDMGGDGGNAKSTRWITSSGSQKDRGEDGSAYDKRIVGMPPGGQRARDGRDLANQGIKPAEVVHHCGSGNLLAHI